MQDDVLVVGSPLESRVYVFRRAAGVWNREAILTNVDGQCCADFFGAAVAVGGDRVFVLASGQGDNGAAYVFRYNPALPDPSPPPSCSNYDPGKWRQREKFVLPPAPHDFIGVDLAASQDGKRLLVGDSAIDAHLFTLAGGEWIETIINPQPGSGTGVEFIPAGTSGDSIALIGGSGGPHLFAELDGGWRQIATLDFASIAASDRSILQAFNDGHVEVHGINPVCLAE